MRRLLAAILAVLSGCASPPVVTRVRDPWQVAIVTVTDQGDVPRRRVWRDEAGFPHLVSFGDYSLTDKGSIVTPDARRDGENIRLLAHLIAYRWCTRPARRCFRRSADIAFVTPAVNVISMVRRE